MNNSGSNFDVSKLKDTEFAEVPYKSLLKILNRQNQDGLLSTISKGVYFIGEKSVDEELIFCEHVDDGKGMFVGYQLFNDVGISDYVDSKIEIYTNNIKAKQKGVGRYLLKRVDLEFDDDTVDLVALLEIIDVGHLMKDCDFMAYKKTVEILLLLASCYMLSKRLERNVRLWYNCVYRGVNSEIDYEKREFRSQAKGRQNYTRCT